MICHCQFLNWWYFRVFDDPVHFAELDLAQDAQVLAESRLLPVGSSALGEGLAGVLRPAGGEKSPGAGNRAQGSRGQTLFQT